MTTKLTRGPARLIPFTEGRKLVKRLMVPLSNDVSPGSWERWDEPTDDERTAYLATQ